MLMLVLVLQACFDGPTECDIEKLKLAFNSTEGQYKIAVLQNLTAYTRMKDFVKTYQDTIIAYNRKQNADTEGFILNFTFFDRVTGNNLISPRLPPYLFNQFTEIHKPLNSLPFYGMDITDGEITISVSNPENYNHDDIVVRHLLTWHTRKWTGKFGTIQRDTLLAGAATYSIFTDCNLGR